MKTLKQLREEMSAGPVSVVGGGAIAGTGEKGGEPGVKLKKKKKVVLFPLAKRK
jgi:hypothetical protein